MDLKTFHKISYGMYIVGSKMDGKLNAQIANTVFQITSEPPTIAISINKQNLMHQFIQTSRVFSVSILAKDTPLSFIGLFGFKSGKEVNKFAGAKYRIGRTGAPIATDNSVAYLEAEVVNQLDAGTHTVFVGKIVDAEIFKNAEPMTYAYYHEVKQGTSPKTAPTYIKDESEMKTHEVVKYRCTVCGYIYDPEKGDPDSGIRPGTTFEQLPAAWACPVCGAPKDAFEKLT